MSARSHHLGEDLRAYMLDHGVREPEQVRLLRAATDALSESGWVSSPEQVQLMTLMAQMIGATSFLEIGTFTGYCSLWMALTLPAGGKVVTLDVVDQFAEVGRPFWRDAGVEDRIELRRGDAEKSLNELIGEGSNRFDIAYIDANKKQYPAYYEACLTLVRSGGLILADNIFWGGSVVEPDNDAKSTVGIRTLVERAGDDDRVDVSLVPIGDGLLIARKR